MIKSLLFSCLFAFFALALNGQTYVYSIDDYGVDSFFLNETYIVTEGATSTSTVVNRYFFSDTARLTQFILDMQLRQENQYTEGTRLRTEAIALQVRIDSIQSKRTFAGLSLLEPGFRLSDPVITAPVPVKGKPPNKKIPAKKPKKKDPAIKPKE